MRRKEIRREEGAEIKKIKLLVRQGNYLAASNYCDKVTFQAVNANEEWIWEQVHEITRPTGRWNSCSYGNVCAMMVYGSKFSNRHPEIHRLRTMMETYCK